MPKNFRPANPNLTIRPTTSAMGAQIDWPIRRQSVPSRVGR